MFDRDLERFLRKLTRLRSENAKNPYGRTREGCRRVDNLRRYLTHYRDLSPSPSPPERGAPILLVGEAYGYRGGRVTGIPLTSEAIIERHPHFARCFPSLASTYVPCGEPGAMQAESTASIVWRVFAEFGQLPAPCCWNIVPLHPYDPERGQWSNRVPTAAEIDAGADFCRDIVELVRPRVVVGVGKCAARGLSKAEIDHVAIRHPSQGGAGLFRSQFFEICRGVDGL